MLLGQYVVLKYRPVRASPIAASPPASRFASLAGRLAELLEPASGILAWKSASARRFPGAGRCARRHCRLAIVERLASTIFYYYYYFNFWNTIYSRFSRHFHLHQTHADMGYLTMKPAASKHMPTCAKWMLIFNSKRILLKNCGHGRLHGDSFFLYYVIFFNECTFFKMKLICLVNLIL